MDLDPLIETIQLDNLTAHALYSYVRHAIANPLQSHVRFCTDSAREMAVGPTINKRS